MNYKIIETDSYEVAHDEGRALAEKDLNQYEVYPILDEVQNETISDWENYSGDPLEFIKDFCIERE